MKNAIGISLLVLGVIVAIMYHGIVNYIEHSPEYKEVQAFEKLFNSLSLGDSEEKVKRVLGEADRIETEFRLGQKEGFENSYARAENSNSVRYLVYFKGIDIVYSVGINQAGNVSLVESGGT